MTCAGYISGPNVGRLLGAWMLEPAPVAALVLAGALYLVGAARTRARWPLWRTASFLAGLLVLASALESGIDQYAEELLSVHMVQHMLLLMVAPALLLWGAPVRLALAASGRRGRRVIRSVLHHRAVRIASRPAVGVSALCCVLVGTYFTGLFEISLRDPVVHQAEHAAYFLTGMICLAPLIAADPLPRPPGALARFAWLTAVMTAMTVVGVILTFGHTIRYPYYLGPARALHVSALADQQRAGALMWVGGGVAGGLLTVVIVMRALLLEERRQRRRDSYAHEASPAGALPEPPEAVLG